ncbi:Uma2 family endonuclease [Allochromatium palmeri]|uniref:Uma2 family endonuclease n=1 Tax=Allochromatium palmeri TaxID=231048 RepID=A0A6N8ECJ6_9GAMM|nr:Uma2 family endonuclease [Allochromatium palmeri]MTW20346.1 Uma2 family endonuclease [Allochromatium palmeri]
MSALAFTYRPTLYEQLAALPEGLTGEILAGQLHTQPRPTGPHGRASVRLDRTIGRGYDDGDGGPGGWWILVEPEVHFIRDQEVAVPDLAGWRRERMPRIPEGHRFEVAPDWICEILSPATASKDRKIKLPLYAQYGVAHVWLVDPTKRTLEVYALQDGAWQLQLQASGEDKVQAPPFVELTLELQSLWV